MRLSFRQWPNVKLVAASGWWKKTTVHVLDSFIMLLAVYALLLFVTFPSPWFRKENFQFFWKVHKFEMNGHVSKSRLWHIWRMYLWLKLVFRYKQTKKIILMFWMNSWVVFFFILGCLALAELGRRGLLLPERLPEGLWLWLTLPIIKRDKPNWLLVCLVCKPYEKYVGECLALVSF